MKHQPSNRNNSKFKGNIFLYLGLSLLIVAEVLLSLQRYKTHQLIGIVMVLVIFNGLVILNHRLGFLSQNHRLLLVIYHIIFGLSIWLIMRGFSPLLYLWIILLFSTHTMFGVKGSALSISTLYVSLLGQSFRVLPASATLIDYGQYILTQILIIVAIAFFLARTQLVNAKDEKLIRGIDQAQLERQRLVSLINSMADGVIATDSNGLIKLFNAGALNIIDTNENLEGKDIRQFMRLIDSSAKTVDPVSEASKTNTNITTNGLLLVYPDGEKINLFYNISPIKLGFKKDSEDEQGFIIAFRDITREKSLEEERNEFVSVVSHELRTPIAIAEANISNAQFVVDKGDNPDAIKTSLDAAHKQTLFLSNMINDLSTLSRAERGILEMSTEEIDPSEIIESIEDDYTKEAEIKNLELKISIDKSTPKIVHSNRLYVREILQNFVNNSIKYTKEGWVQVSVRGAEGGVEFSVQDTGIGISKTDQKRVFDKFFRSEDFRTRESSGTGLGLYVTKKLMKLISAEISLKSKLNEGSTFTIFVPDLEPREQAGSRK